MLNFIVTNHSAKSTATYLRAIDTNGNLIRSYEFKINEDYCDNSNIDASGNLEILGLDNRNIVVLSNCLAYEGLSEDRTFPIEIDHCKAGLINLTDFLEGRDITIKQIY